MYKTAGISFPDDPLEQLRTSIYAVFDSWQSDREFPHQSSRRYHSSMLKGFSGMLFDGRVKSDNEICWGGFPNSSAI